MRPIFVLGSLTTPAIDPEEERPRAEEEAARLSNVLFQPGALLLITQGTRIIGQYGDGVTFGQRRVLFVWHRLILWRACRAEMPAVTPA
ncbi:TrbI/VirB10 family protein [Sagittula marina]|uniref:TrbI/VirB10 family protein n=1 Tax=Sagittula marina TaxID=943940 RepID=UPI003CCCB0EA